MRSAHVNVTLITHMLPESITLPYTMYSPCELVQYNIWLNSYLEHACWIAMIGKLTGLWGFYESIFIIIER